VTIASAPNATAHATFLTEVERMHHAVSLSPVAARVRELAARALDEKDAEITSLRRELQKATGQLAQPPDVRENDATVGPG
jgi:predicted ATPase